MSAIGDESDSYLRLIPVERIPPPTSRAGAFGWLRANLFSSPLNIALTLVCVLFIIWAIPPLVRFFLIDAVWSGSDRDACLPSPALPHPGACWAFVRVWWSYFVYGFYPISERWRVDVFFLALAFGIVWLLRLSAPRRDLGAVYFFVALPCLSFLLLHGPPLLGLTVVPTARGAGFLSPSWWPRSASCSRCRSACFWHWGGAPSFRSSMGIGRVHRIRSRRAADHGAVHGELHAAAIRARTPRAGQACCAP